jgi:tRNA A37 threonylcarbamoyltransferase TsaD
MSLGRIVKTNGRYEWLELSDSEVGEALSDAVDKNIGLFFNVLERVEKHIEQDDWVSLNRDSLEIATAIFNAVAVKGFTALETALRRKVNEIKQNGSK